MSSRPLRVLVVGLGPIGRAVAREVYDAPDLRLVGAVDSAPDLAGKDLGALLKIESLSGRKVAPSLDAVGRRKIDVAVHLTTSSFLAALPLLKELIGRGLHVVTTCEESIAAAIRWPKESRALDRKAREAGVAVLPTGVNPGFAMDLLPAALTNVCVDVRSVKVMRRVDTSARRSALQLKTGAGITPVEFRRRKKAGTIGHAGLRDSLLFLMDHLPLEGVVGEERLRAIVAGKAVRRGRRTIEAGKVLGVHHAVSARAPGSGRTVASLDLKMEWGLADPSDEIVIAGDPPLRLRFEGGIHGDRATVGTVLSTIRFADAAGAGFGA